MFYKYLLISYIIFVSLLCEITVTYSYEIQCEDCDYQDSPEDRKVLDAFKNTFKSKVESKEESELFFSTTENMLTSVDMRNFSSQLKNKTVTKRNLLDHHTTFRSKYIVTMNTCFSCYYVVTPDEEHENDCYTGIGLQSVSCSTEDTNGVAMCFTELGYNYIRRGCAINTPDVIFYCRCNLCNDKSASIQDNFMYLTWEDMDFDNSMINSKNTNVHLICKQCETKQKYGTTEEDQKCIEGYDAAEVGCTLNQVCATYIKGGGKDVRRGCAYRPAYNPWFHYCLGMTCNNESFYSEPYTHVKSIRKRRSIMTSTIRNEKNSGALCQLSNILLFPLIILKYYT